MRVQLFNPPVGHYIGHHYRLNPPLGLPILAAVLNQAGHRCEVADLEALGVDPNRLAESFARQRDRWPDVVGFTALTVSSRGAREAMEAIRAAGYRGKIVVGGVQPTLCPEEWAAIGADLVVTGECEGNLVELLESDAVGIHEGRALPIEQIPLPDWDHHTPSPIRYQGNLPYQAHPQGISMWSRGCPHRCVFCGNPIFHWQLTRWRPPANVAAEMADLKRRGVRSVFVYDDELLGQKQPDGWLSEIADRVGPLNLEWKCQGRCSTRYVDRLTLDEVRRAGCRIVMWGVESFSPRVLRALRKGTTTEMIWHTLRTGKEAGLANFVFTMVGSPEETEEDLAETARCLALAHHEGLIDYRQTSVVTALPGTELWDRQLREGWWHQPPEEGPQMAQCYQDTPWLKAERIDYWLRKFGEACPVGPAGRIAA